MTRAFPAAVLSLVLCVAPCGAADQPPHDPRIELLVTDAYAAPPEFAADALLRIAGSARVTDREWKRQLLDEAFLRAYQAPEAYRRTSARIPPESRQGAEVQAAETGLNRITLQARVVQLMATFAPARARELFEWMNLDVAPATCASPLVPAVDEYYLTMGLIARTAFRGAPIEALQFFEYYLWRAFLPSEMPAVALAVQRFRPSAEDALHLQTLLATILERGDSDPRGFSTANVDIVGRYADLQFLDHQRGVPGWNLIEGVRAYVVRHLNGPRCNDSVTETLLPETFNQALRLMRVLDNEVKPIDGSKIAPTRLLDGARIDLFWQSGTARQLQEAWLALRGRGVNPVPESIRRTEKWLNAADELITKLDEWSGRSESQERDYLAEKCTLYTNIIDLAPVGSVRTRAVRSLVTFMRHEDNDRARRALWFVYVRRLLELGSRDGRADVLAAMEASGNSVIAMYAHLERLVPVGSRASDR